MYVERANAISTLTTFPREYIGERDIFGNRRRQMRQAARRHGPRRHTARTSFTLPASCSRLKGLGRKWMSESSDTLSRKESSA